MDELASDVKAYFDSQGEKAPEPEKPAEAPPEATPEAPIAPEVKAQESPKEEAPPPPDPKEQERESLKKAMEEERSRRKEIASQLKEEIKRREEMQARLDTFLREAEEARKPKPPAYEEDAAGHLKAKTEASEAELRALREKLEKFENLSVQERQEAEFRALVQSQTTAFMEGKPDYGDAYKHVRNIRKAELLAFGVDAATAEAEVSKWEMGLAHTAVQNGKNPAEILYRTAEALGYKGVTNKPADVTNKPQEHIERLAKGQEAAKSLGTGKADAPLSLQKIAEMDDEDLAKFVTGNDWGKLARMF
ncbi:MAG TPA: hypothetical protein VFC18_09685 [Burkholderiales bacterium]|nr:hypothetical protein [Burkholderiales bacterium]